ncbi:hypothetical protein LTR91_022910 [Friedmanniomyces endolithicus]|uniref:Protein RTA1 n=1 Tax=Friedmanniomyces endolithicus TaxID=329885 RepID=A0AAN6H407_9PEZI|nr:hypothetical protein LTR94_003280 [Friedmanniomyces endolithicus]KAK0805133.1 hypothetical protein LTR59_004074 [Friedmanniomyces endolithicus]KAK0814489.1 hypothetical protein LTR38_002779 [Friedmanniomyces endolithicus]KAK0818360.1 hypothetical protein LTR75_002673 [Friedmanniomyces endolithicus]KAK0847426.1 hypothetical protein LTS02_014492 [Friedmanniomyces endolithicus]
MLVTRDDSSSVLNGFEYYHYLPSMGAAVLFIILFGLVTSLHLFQMIRSRTWFMIPFVIGGIFETIGYIGRAVSASQSPGPYTLGPYIIQNILALVSPALFAASIYMELGRIVLMIHGDKALFLRRTWLTKIFVSGDIFSFLMQGAGGGLMGTGDISSIDMGQKLVVGGLFVQVVFFGLFVIAAALFHVRMRKMPTERSEELPWWTRHMMSLYVVSMLIFGRSIVRVVEYLQGFNGYIMGHEAFIYVFDAMLMFIAVSVMAYFHPGDVAKEVRAAKGGRVENESHDKEATSMDRRGT